MPTDVDPQLGEHIENTETTTLSPPEGRAMSDGGVTIHEAADCEVTPPEDVFEGPFPSTIKDGTPTGEHYKCYRGAQSKSSRTHPQKRSFTMKTIGTPVVSKTQPPVPTRTRASETRVA